MARVPETGFYFDPVAERLALLPGGGAFPSGDEWAYVGDPRQMSLEQARVEVAARWPGVDGEALTLEDPGEPALTSSR